MNRSMPGLPVHHQLPEAQLKCTFFREILPALQLRLGTPKIYPVIPHILLRALAICLVAGPSVCSAGIELKFVEMSKCNIG